MKHVLVTLCLLFVIALSAIAQTPHTTEVPTTITLADIDAAGAAVAQESVSREARLDAWLTSNKLTHADHVSSATQLVTSIVDDAITLYGISKGGREENAVRSPLYDVGPRTVMISQAVIDAALKWGGDYIITHSQGVPDPDASWSWPAAVRGARIGSIAGHVFGSVVSSYRLINRR